MSLPGNWTSGQSFSAAAENSVEIAVNANTKGRPVADLYANRPAASAVTTGTLFFCTDCDAVYQSTGTAWNKIRVGGGGNPQLMADAPSSGLSTTTLGSATFTSDRDGRLLTAPAAGASAVRAEYATLSPASGYTVTAKVEAAFSATNYHLSGIVLLNTTSNSLIIWGMSYDTAAISSGPGLVAQKFSNPTTSVGSYVGVGMPLGSISWLQIRDDGTNRYFNYSYNGLDWITAYSVSRTDFITPNAVGWGADDESASGTGLYRLRSFKITTP